MAQEFYERKSATKIIKWQVIEEIIKDDLIGDINELKELEALSEGTKEQLLNNAPELAGSTPDINKTLVENFDTAVKKKREKFQDLLDYWDYDRLPASGIEQIQASWADLGKLAQGSGAVVQSVCGEEVGLEAIRALDGATGSHWEHDADERHSITIDLTYPKTFDGVRLWIPNATPRFDLNDVVIRCSASLGAIDNPENIISSGVAFSGDGVWSEHIFAGGKKRARYIKLDNMDSAHSSNAIRVREIEVRAYLKFFDIEGN